MLVREMDRGECLEVLTRTGFGRLGCSRENQPYIVPIYFAVDQDSLYGFATVGQKIQWMRDNPSVCVEAEEVKSHIEWASVVVIGRYEEFPDLPVNSQHRRLAEALLEKRALWWQTAFGAAQARGNLNRDIPVIFRVRATEITGRHASPDPVEESLGASPTRTGAKR
jgi:nitroimidazol reductase NimA-like FMN-containing flavoprotein (pyridoxamine 5'-phosphate oxidase superfamily)